MWFFHFFLQDFRVLYLILVFWKFMMITLLVILGTMCVLSIWKKLLSFSMATRSSVLAWKTPWTEEPGRLQSMGVTVQSMVSQTVRCDWATERLHFTLYFLEFSWITLAIIFSLYCLLLKFLLFRCQIFWANPLIFSLILSYFPALNLSVLICGILPKLCFPYTY